MQQSALSIQSSDKEDLGLGRVLSAGDVDGLAVEPVSGDVEECPSVVMIQVLSVVILVKSFALR